MDVDEWDRTRHKKESGEYVFVSYTRTQYQTYTKQQIMQWDKRDAPKTEQDRKIRAAMPELQEGDLNQLYQIGTLAAQNAGVNAFWIDVLCITAETALLDSHRICDIARGAKRLVIALKDPVHERILKRDSLNASQLLQDWASRLWTLPEMLLAPTQYDLAIYRSSATTTTVRYWKTIPKRNMAEEAYKEDGLLVRQLVDHFESNLHLTQTELLSIGLECLMRKEFSKHAAADPVYALMTLARRRPVPTKGETLFEAFARISLLNDSNMLLERLICFLPPRRGEPWHKIEDFWGAKLWDIYPTCQIAGIAEDQTVIIDGAFAASIEWGELKPIGFLKRQTLWRRVAEFMVLLTPGWLIAGILMLATYSKPMKVEDGLTISKRISPTIAVGIIFFLAAATAFLLLPATLLSFYRGKFWSTQASLVGLEGVPDLDWLERKLFGFSEGRLKWSPYSSTQSKHKRKVFGKRLKGELEAIEPSDNALPVTTNSIGRQLDTTGGPTVTNYQVDPDRIFTLVDTYTMTVTTFRAVHPPSVIIICGHEGGMRRALLCSYDYKMQTFHRESVLRMSTKVLDKMDRIEKFRFSMESMPLLR
jgi:hypothetical protein